MMFRHTRDTLREYFRLGLLDKDVPQREVRDNAITLEPLREAELYRQVSDYVRHFYRLAQKEQRKALGFLMTLYRKRLTSSFYAIQQSLQRRLDALIDQQGSGLTEDDLNELDEIDEPIIDGLEDFIEPVDPREIEYLESLLRQFDNTGEDTKLAHFISILRQELVNRESAIAFTQYTDTMDFLREQLRELYGDQVACYSGRGGERWQDGQWTGVAKEVIKRQFREGAIKILLCTESASEGLNLQTCGVLINYDLPWNPDASRAAHWPDRSHRPALPHRHHPQLLLRRHRRGEGLPEAARSDRGIHQRGRQPPAHPGPDPNFHRAGHHECG
jgi:ERCC4-related helicase